jgi:hypothetical protein
MRRQTEIMWGVIALALVGWWTARSLGVIPIGLDDLIVRGLPALLVLAGLVLLLRRRVPLGGFIALVLTGALVGGVAWSAYSSRAGQQRTDTQQPIAQPADPALSLLRVRVNTLETDVEIVTGAAPGVVGQFTGSADNRIRVDYQIAADNTATLTLDEERQSGDFPLLETVGRGTLRLEVPTTVPLDLVFTTRQGDMLLNLGGGRVETLNVTALVGNVLVSLPDYDPVYSQDDALIGTLTAAQGELVLVVPRAVAARLELDRRGSGIEPQFDRARYDQLVGDVLQAVDIRTAAKVVRYALVAGRGQIRVETTLN